MDSYKEFLKKKRITTEHVGFEVALEDINQKCMDYQQAIIRWALRRGRAAIFGDTGNGKTIILAEWAKHVAAHTGGKILIATPLAVAMQTVEMAKDLLDIDIGYARHQSQVEKQITITNYEMLDEFDLMQFDGFVIDESSILKSSNGKTRDKLIELAQSIPYRLALTATPSPNDTMELGNHSEFLGIMRQVEMLAMYFTHDSGDTSKWVLKGHGKRKFWEWMATWACCFRNPTDLGFDGSRHVLPALNIHRVIIDSNPSDGELFPTVSDGLLGRNKARRESLEKRVEESINIANSFDEPVVTWCLLNDEQEMLESGIDNSVSIQGSDSIDHKEKSIHGFVHGEFDKLIGKTSIFGFGLNLQRCSKTVFCGINDSFEQLYQAIKRFHRFGQTKPVDVWLVYSEAEGPIYENIMKKWRQHENMQAEMVEHMKDAMRREIFGAACETEEYAPTKQLVLPSFIKE